MFKKYIAFTLAEVLITLGIIGIVAEMTIPTLINNTQEQIYKVAYKKAYSTFSQAFLRASGEGNLIDVTGLSSATVGAEANFATYKSYFLTVKECTSSNVSECWASTGETWRGEVSAPSFIDKSGMAWKLNRSDGSYNACVILIDTNGFKKPNQYGLDRFVLFLYNGQQYVDGIPNKIVPMEDVTATDSDSQTYCPSVAKHPCYFTSWLFN